MKMLVFMLEGKIFQMYFNYRDDKDDRMVIVMVRKKLLVIPDAHGLGRVRLRPHVHGGARARGGAGQQVIMLIKLVLLIMHQFDHVG